MSFAATWAYDVANVLCNTTERGEATDFEQPDMAAAAISVSAVWGPVELAELGNGFIADSCSVWAPVASFVAAGETVVPRRSRGGASETVLIRYPTAAPESRERWEVDAVRRSGPTYAFDCLRNIRAGAG